MFFHLNPSGFQHPSQAVRISYSGKTSLLNVLERGTKGWITHASDRGRHVHKDIAEPKYALRESEWWPGSLSELVIAAFGDRIVDAKYIQKTHSARSRFDDIEES